MGFTVSGLGNYTDQLSKDLLTPALFGGVTAAFATKMLTVKSSEALQLLDNTIYIQDGTSCGFNASGTSTFTQRNMTTYPLKVQDSLCMRDLEAKWTQILLNAGQNYEDMPIPQVILQHYVNKTVQTLESQDWFGTVAGVAKYDGIGTIVDAAATYVSATSQASVSTSTVIGILDDIYAKVPAAVLSKKIHIFIGWEDFRIAVTAYKNANYFNYDPKGYENGRFNIPGTSLELVAVYGLNAAFNTSHKMYAIADGNLFLGVDGNDEEMEAKAWFSMDNDTHRLSIRFRRGWQVAYPAEIVRYANT